jgi:transcriptional regulator with XRE-family HTH domain
MADNDTDDLSPARLEQQRLGQALRQLRLRYGFTQAQAAERFDVSTQAWQRYEAGERRFPDWKLIKLATAAGGTLDELMDERKRLQGPGGEVVSLAAHGRAYHGGPPAGSVMAQLASLLGPNADAIRLNSGALSPWAESGELIVFDRERPPRREQGCVVQMDDGSLSVWIFEGRDAEGVHVRSLYPEPHSEVIPGADRGVFAVRFRGD